MKRSREKRLSTFLRILKTASRNHGLCIQWAEDGIEIREVDPGDADPDDFVYSCVVSDGGFDDPDLVAKDLIYDG